MLHRKAILNASRGLRTTPFTRNCFVPIYGKCDADLNPAFKFKGPISSPNTKNAMNWTDVQTEDGIERDFEDSYSAGEIRLTELAKYNRLNEVMYILRNSGTKIHHEKVAKIVAQRLSYHGRTKDIEFLQSNCKTETQLDLRKFLFHSYVIEGDSKSAEKLFNELSNEKIKLGPRSEFEFLKLMCKDVGISEMVDIAKKYDIIPPMEIHDFAVEQLLSSNDINGAINYLDYVRTFGTEPDTQLLNKFISYHVKNNNLPMAEEIIVSKKTK